MLAACNLSTRLTIRDNAHALDTLRNAHLRVKDASVCSEVHASDVVGGERGVLQLYPSLTSSEFILNASGVVGKHLIQTDVFGSLSHHRRGTCQHHAAEQDFDFIHFFVYYYMILGDSK